MVQIEKFSDKVIAAINKLNLRRPEHLHSCSVNEEGHFVVLPPTGCVYSDVTISVTARTVRDSYLVSILILANVQYEDIIEYSEFAMRWATHQSPHRVILTRRDSINLGAWIEFPFSQWVLPIQCEKWKVDSAKDEVSETSKTQKIEVQPTLAAYFASLRPVPAGNDLEYCLMMTQVFRELEQVRVEYDFSALYLAHLPDAISQAILSKDFDVCQQLIESPIIKAVKFDTYRQNLTVAVNVIRKMRL